MTEDNRIIELFLARSEQAIAELALKYGAVCTRIAQNILKNTSDAEECVNDTYLAVWNSIPPQEPNPLKTYVCRIVRNLSIARYHSNTAAKRNSYYDEALDELENCLATQSTVEDEISAKELTVLLEAFLDSLDAESRIMFVRRYWYADSVSDIAVRCGISANNAAVRLCRIREKLRVYLREEGYCL